MIKNFFYGLVFCVNLLEVDAAQVFSDYGVTQNFKAMLEDNRIVGEQDFATFVTRSFLRSSSNIELSNPTFSHWRQLQSSYNAASPQPDALHIFETLGISFRGIMNSPHKDRWGAVVGAEREGMLNIIQGSLGIESRRATKKEEAVMARELLNLGRSLGWGIHEKLESLKTKYDTERESFKKQHFQMTALYLLVGSGQAPHPGAWYFNGVDEHNAIKHVLSYAGNLAFLPISSPNTPPSKGAVYASNQGFVNDVGDLNTFRYVETLDGGTGGVHVFRNGEHKVLIKCSVHTNHIKEEIIADALYAALGVPVPKFFVVNELPSGAATGAGVGAGGVVADGFSQVRARCPKGPYRVSEFIEGDRAASETAEKVRVRRHFLVDVLLANRDVKPENLIVSGGIPNRVDNGGALRYRSLGERKDQEPGSTWSHLLLPERKTLLEYNADRYGGKLSDEDILAQAREILKKSDLIFLTLQELYAALQLPLKDQQELDDMMLERLKILTMYANPTATFVAPKHVTVTKGMAAGAFVLAQKDGVWHVLLGLRKSARPESNNKWCTLGGMADVGEDMDLPHAAAREMFEESGGRLNISHTVLANQPSHDLVRWDHRFRQYFVTHNYFDVSDLRYHEYHRFAWVPLEKVISTNLGELGDFFPPFLELLHTQQVQKILRDFQESKKLPRHVHTQSTPGAVMDADRKGPAIQQFRIGRSIPRIKKHEEESLAKTIFHKAMVHEEIRDRQVPLATGAGAAAGGAGAGAASDVVTFDDEDVPHMRFNLNTEMGARFPYTQSEGHLSLYLGEDYVPITTDNLEEQRHIYLQNINRFFGKEPGAFGELDIDESFKQKMVDVLIQERQMGPEYTVFYHGCEGNIGYLYDIFTELRQLLRLHFAKDRVVLRALDQAFQGIENVNEFVSKLTTQARPDYSPGYADSAISANVSLFGNMDRKTSCTLSYFYNNFSIEPVELVSFINFINATLPGLTLSKDRYQRLFETVMVKKPEADGRLLQIFVKNDHVDEFVYAAQAGGRLFTLEKDGRSESIGSCLNLLKSKPSNAALLMEGVEYIDGVKKSPHSIQARLFLKPELTHDTDVMKTFMYHRVPEVTPDKIQRLKTELRRYLAEDLARWMQGKVPPAEGELHDGSTKAVDIFKEHYTQVFGRAPTYAEESLNNQLLRIRDTKNLALLFSLAEKYPLKTLLMTKMMDAQSYRHREGRTPEPILLFSDGMFDTVSTLDDPFKKQLVDATLPILQEYVGAASIKALQILKDLNFFTAENFWPTLRSGFNGFV